jgi:hypothetical protein
MLRVARIYKASVKLQPSNIMYPNTPTAVIIPSAKVRSGSAA